METKSRREKNSLKTIFRSDKDNGEMTLRPNGVQQWYYMMELDIFGPSRYIGYQEIDINKYNRAYSLDGGKTTYALSEWFVVCDSPDLIEKITDKLVGYLSQSNMDVRRNSNKQPSFKLNFLQDDIPKLKKLYLSEKVVIDNGKCQTCNKSFWEEPFHALKL